MNLSQFQGQTVTIGFRFDTVDGIQNDFPGWRIDNIRVNAVVTTTTCTQACYANCDESTGTPALTPADFVCFLNKFRAGDPYANCDASTGTPALTPADFVCFLSKFRAGC
ncbi:hypothetical protein J4558_24865 [Leptolyngbya sp. 15MV]|nr:hypothetical protein J4558_24865 [Leptolyngbya sp. 15MV]